MRELLQIAPLLLGRSTQATGTVDKAGDAVHLQNLVLLGRRDVLHEPRHERRTHAALREVEHAERERDWWLTHLDDVAHADGTRRLDVVSAHRDAPFLAGLGRQRPRLEESHGPHPFIYSDFVHKL